MKIFHISGDLAACHRYRSLEPCIALNHAGIECGHFNPIGKPTQVKMVIPTGADLVLIQRLTHPVLKHFVDAIRAALPNAKLVYEQDDNLFDLHPSNPAHWYFSKKEIQDTIKELYDKSDAIIVTTEELKSQLLEHTTKPIYVIENLINTTRFKPVDRKESDQVTITWGGGDCVDDKTQIMTKDGYKDFEDLTYDDLIATLNPNTNQLEYQKPTRIIKEQYSGPMHQYETGNVSYCVTPNHKMYMATDLYTKYKLIKRKDIKNNFFVYTSTDGNTRSLVRIDHENEIDYNGTIYCVEVPNHIWNMRRNGKSMWTGNSHLPDIKVVHGLYKYIENMFPQVHFKFIGFVPTFLDLAIDRYERVEWGTIDTFAESLADSDISIAPLANNFFNKAKCLDESTLVSTIDGIKRISELIVGDMIYDGKSFKEIQVVNKEEYKLGKKITTKSGVEILATNNHRLLVNGDWRLVENIKLGDTLTKTKIKSNSAYQTVKFPLFHSRMTRKEYGNNIFNGGSMPFITIDETWGKLLGIFAGDGSCNYTTMSIHIDGIDSDIINIVQNLFKNVGMNTSTNNVLCKNGKLNRRRVVQAFSSRLLDFIEHLGLAEQIKNTRKTRRIIKVPDVIFKSPPSVISSFLSGLFEADGSVYGTCVDLSSKNKEFLADVQTLLLLFGCNSHLRKSSTVKDKDYYKLFLTREFCEVFENKIGFISKRKQEKLSELTSKKHSNAYKEYNWQDEIILIEDHYLTPIDIQVDGEKFVANGIISHNSAIKPAESAACGVPSICSKEPPYQVLPPDIFPLCKNEKDWVKWLTRFITDKNMRQEYGRKQQQYVLENINLWKNVTKRIEIYSEIIGCDVPDLSKLNLSTPHETPEPPEELFGLPPIPPSNREQIEADFNAYMNNRYGRILQPQEA